MWQRQATGSARPEESLCFEDCQCTCFTLNTPFSITLPNHVVAEVTTHSFVEWTDPFCACALPSWNYGWVPGNRWRCAFSGSPPRPARCIALPVWVRVLPACTSNTFERRLHDGASPQTAPGPDTRLCGWRWPCPDSWSVAEGLDQRRLKRTQ